jgi:hypothetical protein
MLLNRNAIFDLWAPAAAPWSAWTKPLLFVHLDNAELQPGAALSPPAWAPPADATTLIVSDLPGPLSVHAGEALAYAGFRPVPLFNAVPGPAAELDQAFVAQNVVDVASIIDAMRSATERSGVTLRSLAADAPPAFLLDAARRTGHAPRPGDFDNRSVSLPTDFPSAAFLTARGIARVVLLVAEDPTLPAADLSHTLLRWQEAGIQIFAMTVDDTLHASALQPIRVHKPKWFRVMWQSALALVGLRRHPLGGFGGTLPHPSSG